MKKNEKGDDFLKVLITGGAGFIGSHVVEACIAQHHKVVVVDNFSSGKSENIPTNCKVYSLDINDEDVKKVINQERPDAIIHLAAQASVMKSIENPLNDSIINIIGSLRLFEYAKLYNVKKIVFASSAAVYGNPDTLPLDEKFPLNPLSFYALSKWSGEHYAQLYENLFNLPCCIFRFSNVYGPRQNTLGEAGVVAMFINQILNQKEVTIYGGQQTRDFVYVKDVAKACLLAIENCTTGIFNISTNSKTSIDELFALISTQANMTSTPRKQPIRIGEIENSVLSNEKAKRELNWQPIYSLQEGVEETIRSLSISKKQE